MSKFKSCSFLVALFEALLEIRTELHHVITILVDELAHYSSSSFNVISNLE